MTKYRQILSTAGLTAQFLGLGLAILLLTNLGRSAVSQYGLLNVLAVAGVFFAFAEIAIVVGVTRHQGKSSQAASQTSGAEGALKSD